MAKLFAAVGQGGFALNDKRLSVLSMSEDGLSVTGETQWFASYGQRIRDVAVNPYTGAVYLAFNGPSYPGSGPNIIKEFRNLDYQPVTAVAGMPLPLARSTTMPTPRKTTTRASLQDAPTPRR